MPNREAIAAKTSTLPSLGRRLPFRRQSSSPANDGPFDLITVDLGAIGRNLVDVLRLVGEDEAIDGCSNASIFPAFKRAVTLDEKVAPLSVSSTSTLSYSWIGRFASSARIETHRCTDIQSCNVLKLAKLFV